MSLPPLPPAIEVYRKQIDTHLSQYQALNTIQEKTKVDKVLIALVGVLFVSISVLFNVLHVFTTNMIATVVPAVRFLEAAQKGDVDTMKTFGFYFLVLSVIDLIEDLVYDSILYYNPYWWAQKLILVSWMFFPQYLGAKTLYNLVAPYYAQISGSSKKAE
ncbi:ER membrane protein DP1/Yop1 [Podochytrium sp. JEL0797]|nr:ER membrane protein DP1/Yop1 [Podochytrium sp. JEL0797]